MDFAQHLLAFGKSAPRCNRGREIQGRASSARLRRVRLMSEMLEPRLLLTADIRVVDANLAGEAEFDETVLVGDDLYFIDADPVHGAELRRLDLATDEVSLVADIATGITSAFNQNFDGFAHSNGKLYFVAYDVDHGTELRWIDTEMANPVVNTIDIKAGAGSSFPFGIHEFILAGDRLYFGASDDASGSELRWIDTGITNPVINTVEVEVGAGSASPSAFHVVGSTLYFTAFDSMIGNELRSVDTTSSSTQVTAFDIRPGTRGSTFTTRQLASLGDKLYFTADDGSTGRELHWIDTGLAQPAVNTLDIDPGQSGSDAGIIGGLIVANERLYFRATDEANGEALRWIGANPGSPSVNVIDQNIRDIAFAGGFIHLENKLFFVGRNNARGNELRWVDTLASDSVVNTIDIEPGTGDSDPGASGFAAIGEKIFFSAEDGESGRELRSIDASGALPIVETVDLRPGSDSATPDKLTPVNDRLYFTAFDEFDDQNLHWIVADDVSQTSSISLSSSTDNSSPDQFVEVGDKLFFVAEHPTKGEELRWIDARELNPIVHTIDVVPGSEGSRPRELHAVGEKLFFGATTPATGYELHWIDTSSPSPVVEVLELEPGPAGSRLSAMHSVGSRLFFQASDTTHGQEVRWVDSSLANPSINTIDTNPGPPNGVGGITQRFRDVGGNLYFFATDINHGYELRWLDLKSLSTVPNTIDINPGTANSFPSNPMVVGDKLFFSASDGVYGRELRWIDTTSDAPEVNTIEIAPGTGGSTTGQSFKIVGTRLFFTANGDEFGNELRWLDTATDLPIVNTLDIRRGSIGSGAGFFGFALLQNHNLYFVADSALYGRELFWLDASFDTEPVLNVIDYRPGGSDSNPTIMASVGDRLYFRAEEGVTGLELRSIDTAMAEPVVETHEIRTGQADSDVENAIRVGNRLFVDAIHDSFGRELFYVENASRMEGDFNGDGSYSCADVDFLSSEVAGDAGRLTFDMNRDGSIDFLDIEAWLQLAGMANGVVGGRYLPGDANLDGSVDISDFNIWNEHKFLQNSNWCDGDFNADGFTDVADFNLWNSNKFLPAMSRSEVETSPEPWANRPHVGIDYDNTASRQIQFSLPSGEFVKSMGLGRDPGHVRRVESFVHAIDGVFGDFDLFDEINISRSEGSLTGLEYFDA